MEAEKATRKQRIDPRLAAAGWTVVEADSMGSAAGDRLAIREFQTANGPADYALFDSGRCLGVAEAKKLTVGPQEVLTQALRYSRGIFQTPLYQGEYGVPFLYSTNGEIIRFQDARHPLNRSRQVSGFHTPAALREMLERDLEEERDRLATLPMPSQLRLYQVEANESVEQAIRSPYFQHVFASEKLGSAQARINLGDLRGFALPLPPIDEQAEIIQRVEQLRTLADRLSDRLAAADVSVARSAQAVLAKALRGELMANGSAGFAGA